MKKAGSIERGAWSFGFSEADRIAVIILVSVLIGLALGLSGCSAVQQKIAPSIFPQLQKPVEKLIPRPLSDADILYFADGVKGLYGGRSVAAQVTDLSGAVTLSGLSTGAMLFNAGGASPTVISAIVAAGAFLSQALGIVDPATRANALSEGSGLLRTAENDFILCMVNSGVGTPPTDKITPCGATLFVSTNSAVNVTERILVGLIPNVQDLERFKPSAPIIVTTPVPVPTPAPTPAKP